MEKETHAELDCLYLCKDKNNHDHWTRVDHNIGDSSSQQTFKGVIKDSAQGSFFGQINIKKDAQKSKAKQLNKNLLLSEKARAFSKPRLAIDADDVKCSHGATVGKVRDEEIFYLQSRGIKKKAAEQLLVNAFMFDIIEKHKTKNDVDLNELKGLLELQESLLEEPLC